MVTAGREDFGADGPEERHQHDGQRSAHGDQPQRGRELHRGYATGPDGHRDRRSGQRAERIGAFTYPLPDRFRHLVGQQEQLFFANAYSRSNVKE